MQLPKPDCRHNLFFLQGIFPILRDFWLLIPAHTIKQIFQLLLKKLIVDASSAEVRRLVVQVSGSLQLNNDRSAAVVFWEFNL